jgi:hypothetical protein
MRNWNPIESAPKSQEIALGVWYIPSEEAARNGAREAWVMGKGCFINEGIGWSGIITCRPSHWTYLSEDDDGDACIEEDCQFCLGGRGDFGEPCYSCNGKSFTTRKI